MKHLILVLLVLTGTAHATDDLTKERTTLYTCEGTHHIFTGHEITSSIYVRVNLEITEREFTPGVPSCHSGVERMEVMKVIDKKISYSVDKPQCDKRKNGFVLYHQGSNLPNEWSFTLTEGATKITAVDSSLWPVLLSCKKYLKP